LKDRAFCTPDADEAAAVAERAKKAEMDKEIEAVKKEYAEKIRKKMEKRKEKDKHKGKDKEKDKEETKKDEEEDKKDEAEKEAKVRCCLHGQKIFANMVTDQGSGQKEGGDEGRGRTKNIHSPQVSLPI
jgi:hypothetical protein